MSTHILSACWRLSGMSSTQKLVLISLADQANDDGVCWPSISRMSERTCLSDRAIRDAVKWLTESGVLSVEHRYNSSNVYTISPCNFQPDSEDSAPPAPSSPPAPSAGTPCAKRRYPLRQVPTNRQGTVREPSVGSADAPAAPAGRIETGQEYIARITKHEDARIPVTMTATWKPSESFADKLKMALVNPGKLTDELLAMFKIHHDGESKPQNKWESALVTWCKRERPEAESKAAAPKKQSTGPVYKELKPGPPKVANDPNDPEWIARQAQYRSMLK
jgi:hypothetical protein